MPALAIAMCPLRALLNNLQPRLSTYAQWLGRTAEVRHGDTTAGQRKRLQSQPPDILLTTPEFLEAMLVSTITSPKLLLENLRAIVVDEVHAFAGDDRGWHLQGVLSRLEATAGRPMQRIGLSANVGNPHELLHWLRGPGRDGAGSHRSWRSREGLRRAAGLGGNPRQRCGGDLPAP